MLSIRSWFCPVSFILLAFAATSDALQHKRAVPFGSSSSSSAISASLNKRNWGGELKDWYLSKFTKNYFCTDTGRLVPVDPETGHMLLRGLRKRSNFIDDLLGHSHSTEHGLCHDPSWVLPPGWTQPIPVTQFVAQYPWMQVDDRGQIRLKDDYKAWLDQQGAAQAAGLTSPAAVGGQASAAPGGSNAMVVPDGGVGYVPSSYLNVAPGMGTTSGLGQNAFGNGVSAGAAAHV